MFGDFNLIHENKQIDIVEFYEAENSSYQAANKDRRVIIDTPLGRVYINNDSYFSKVPKNVWTSYFKDEVSPAQLLESLIGNSITDEIIKDFQNLLSDLIDAEYSANNEES